MNIRRIKGVFMQEVYITLHSLEVGIDVFLFPLVNIVIFGLISLYLADAAHSEASHFVFLGMLLWQVIGITSYSVAVGAMWNIWSKNLSNMFIAPLKASEYVTALFVSGCLKAILLLVVGGLLSTWVFQFNVLDVGLINLILMFVVFALFGLALAVATLGIIFRFGTRLAALAWSMPWVFQPLSAAFFPVSVLPETLQWLAYALPPTYAFEAVRHGLLLHTVEWTTFGIGIVLALVYCLIGIAIFQSFFKQSRISGQFARNEA